MAVRARPSSAALALLAVLPAVACSSVPPDPTLLVEANGAVESGVSTVHGIVFLGHTARTGEVSFVAWFHDGPSREIGIVEPLGGGLFTTESPILLPAVPVAFERPSPGDEVRVLARFGTSTREFSARVADAPSVEGLLLEMDDDLRDLGPEQVGTGVYLGEGHDRRLVGLISGRVRLATAAGERDYVTVVGPDDLWRLAAYQREVTRKRRWVYREDIL